MTKFLSLLTLALFISCGTTRTSQFDTTTNKTSLSEAQFKENITKANKYWEKRHIKKNLQLALKHYEILAKASTGDEFYKYATRLSRGFYILADAHFNDDESKRKYWSIGIEWAERALGTNAKFKKSMKENDDINQALKYVKQREIAATYWTAANLGKWAKSQGITTTLKYKNQIRTMIKHVENTDPMFFHSAAYRYWGVYYAVAPGFAGGDWL